MTKISIGAYVVDVRSGAPKEMLVVEYNDFGMLVCEWKRDNKIYSDIFSPDNLFISRWPKDYKRPEEA